MHSASRVIEFLALVRKCGARRPVSKRIYNDIGNFVGHRMVDEAQRKPLDALRDAPEAHQQRNKIGSTVEKHIAGHGKRDTRHSTPCARPKKQHATRRKAVSTR